MRYLVLLLLNLPIILLALLNIITQYKIGKIPRQRFRRLRDRFLDGHFAQTLL